MLTSSVQLSNRSSDWQFTFRKAAFNAVNAHFVANGIQEIPEAIAKFCREQLRLDLDEKERYEKAKELLMPFYWRRYGGEQEKKVRIPILMSHVALTTGQGMFQGHLIKQTYAWSHLSYINSTSVHVTNLFRKHYGDKPPGGGLVMAALAVR